MNIFVTCDILEQYAEWLCWNNYQSVFLYSKELHLLTSFNVHFRSRINRLDNHVIANPKVYLHFSHILSIFLFINKRGVSVIVHNDCVKLVWPLTRFLKREKKKNEAVYIVIYIPSCLTNAPDDRNLYAIACWGILL